MPPRRCAAIALLAAAAPATAQTHLVPLFPAAPAAPAAPAQSEASAARQGFVRIVNHSGRAGDVRIVATDDAGAVQEPITLRVAARQALHFNSQHLRDGNFGIGLPGIGDPSVGAENWRLALSSALDIEVLAYLRTADGFLASMHDLAPATAAGGARIAFFNPARNANQISYLRLVNPGTTPTTVTIRGVDDHGSAADMVRATLPAGAARTYSAVDLERGHAQLEGALGEGRGKWRLAVNANAAIHAMSLLASPTGHLTNLSSVPPAPARIDDLNVHRVAYFPAGGQARQGFLRIVNAGAAEATVAIRPVDALARPGRAATLQVAAGRTVHVNSERLERGDAPGLAGGIGPGTGPWRLELSTTAAIEVLPYIRTADGFLTSMADVAPAAGNQHRVAIFNPGRNVNQVSRLHLANDGREDAGIVVLGIDDRGQARGPVRLTLPAGSTRTLSALALENGGDVAGALGTGRGKWRLTVAADRPIGVLSLLESPTGHLTNLSSAAERSAKEFFEALIRAPVLGARCVNCHVPGGQSDHTRLVFSLAEDADNHAVFQRFVDEVPDGAALILAKVQGSAEHGGGVQVPAGSADYANLRTYMERIASEAVQPLRPAVAVPLFDALPAPATDVDPATQDLHIVHADAADVPSFGYGGRCQPTGRTLRRNLEDLSTGATALADHRLRCQLAPMDNHRVWADGIGAGGSFHRAELAFMTGADQGPPTLAVRATRTIPQDDVNGLFHAYLIEALADAIDDPAQQVAAVVLIDQIARRTWLNLRDPEARYDVVTESVSYVSRDPRGARSGDLTGLVARPEVAAAPDFEPRPQVLLLSHATGSTPSAMRYADAWYAVAAMFAGRGYLVLAPDNWGRGELAPEGQPETYLMANRTAGNSLDMLRAVLADPRYEALRVRTGGKVDVAVAGYSQGGHSALALWLAMLGGDYPWRLKEVHSGGAPHDLYRTLRGALAHVAGRCDGGPWCREVDPDVVVPYAAGRILPSLLAYMNVALAAEDVVADASLRPDFLAGMLGEDARYDALKTALQLNSFTNLVGLERFAEDRAAIHLYHSPFDRLVPAQNTLDLGRLLAPHFDVEYHRDECTSPAYAALAAAGAGLAHAICGMEVLDDVLRALW